MVLYFRYGVKGERVRGEEGRQERDGGNVEGLPPAPGSDGGMGPEGAAELLQNPGTAYSYIP